MVVCPFLFISILTLDYSLTVYFYIFLKLCLNCLSQEIKVPEILIALQCSRNIWYYQCWKELCCIIFLWKPWNTWVFLEYFFSLMEGLIFRFKFLMLVTLACAAMTIIFFIISQVWISCQLNQFLHVIVYWYVHSYGFRCVLTGEWGSLALGWLHGSGEQCLLHRNLWHVEPLCICPHVSLCTVSQALWGRAIKRWDTWTVKL